MLRKGEKKEENTQIAQLKKEAEDARKSSILSSIDAKLKAGALLTDDELQYLRENSPELYQEAMDIKREREQYKKQLKACRTKEDVQKLNMTKLQSFVSEMRAVCSNPSIPKGEKIKQANKILRRVMGIQNEHLQFTKTQEYQQMPSEQEIREEEDKEKKRKKVKTPSMQPEDTELFQALQKDLFDLLAGLGKSDDGSQEVKQEEASGVQPAQPSTAAAASEVSAAPQAPSAAGKPASGGAKRTGVEWRA